MAKKLSQNAKVLRYMIAHKGITDLECSDNLRIARLSARIHDLRDSGYKIATDYDVVNGKKNNHATYRLRS